MYALFSVVGFLGEYLRRFLFVYQWHGCAGDNLFTQLQIQARLRTKSDGQTRAGIGKADTITLM